MASLFDPRPLSRSPLVTLDTRPALAGHEGRVAASGAPVGARGWSAVLWTPVPAEEPLWVESTAYWPDSWERDLVELAARGAQRLAVQGPGGPGLVWLPTSQGSVPLPYPCEVGGIFDDLLGLVGGLPIVGPLLQTLGLGGGGGAGAGGAGAGAGGAAGAGAGAGGAAGAGAGAGGAGGLAGLAGGLGGLLPLLLGLQGQSLAQHGRLSDGNILDILRLGGAGGAGGGLDLAGLAGMLGGVAAGGQAGQPGAAAGASAEALTRALGTMASSVYGVMQGPLADLLRGAIRTTEASVRAMLAGDTTSQEWVSTALRRAEGQIADSMRLASLLMTRQGGL